MNDLTDFGRYAIVVAHPDDEILWFGSLVENADRIIFCYNDDPLTPEIGPARKGVIAEYPLNNLISLGLPEPQSLNKADWKNPVPLETGLYLGSKQSRHIYEANYDRLTSLLYKNLTNIDLVFTHNPWGEYGHEDHVQVSQAVKSIMPSQGSQIFVSTYFSLKSALLMSRTMHQISNQELFFTVNQPKINQIKLVYQKNECWTWNHDWFPPSQERFIALKAPSSLLSQSGFNTLLPFSVTFIPMEEEISFWRKLLQKVWRRINKIKKWKN